MLSLLLHNTFLGFALGVASTAVPICYYRQDSAKKGGLK